MSEETLNETQPMQTSAAGAGETMPTRVGGGETSSGQPTGEPAPARKRNFGWVGPVLIGWLILLGVATFSGYRGYQTAVADRIVQQSTQAVEELDAQYELGLQDFAAGKYELARQRFAYILEQDPNYVKAIEMLARTLAIIQATATPTPVTPTPTPTLTPTPDLRDVEEIFSTARAAMEGEDWDTAISTLLSLRKKDPAYRAVDVDSMLYVAFRYRGVYKILNTGELESGLLDLSQAERFGPIDSDAQSYANFARLFGIGVSFWEVDWAQAAYYFGQVAPYLPNMHNGDNWYASQRYVEAMQNYIDQLVAGKNWCEAQIQMQALSDFSSDPQFEPTQAWLDDQCSKGSKDDKKDDDKPPEATPTPPDVTPTPEETTPPEETATPEETAPPEDTPVPTETPAP